MGKYGTKVYLCTEFIYLQWKSACDKMLLITPLKCILGLINHSHWPLNFYCKKICDTISSAHRPVYQNNNMTQNALPERQR